MSPSPTINQIKFVAMAMAEEPLGCDVLSLARRSAGQYGSKVSTSIRTQLKEMSERLTRAVVAYRLKSVAERNSEVFLELEDSDLRERSPLYREAMGDDAYYQLLLADMLFEQFSIYTKLGARTHWF